MKRDPRLVELSRDHYRALVLSAFLRRGGDAAILRARIGEEFTADLEPHFRIEEEWLLAPLCAHAEAREFVARGRADHAALRAGAAQAQRGEYVDPVAWGQRLHDHVRFEERELFPLCERLLTSTELDALANRLRARGPSGAP